jgi:Fe-S-cluster containining protein
MTSDRDLAARAEREAIHQRLDAFLASRDAAHAVTADALAESVTVDSAIAAADAAAEFVDRAQAIVIAEYRPPLACNDGCCYCCRKPGVLVSMPELLRLLRYVEDNWDESSREALSCRAQQYIDRLGGRDFSAPTRESIPCPFLVGGRCSAYDVRPLVCRGYNSTSADACRRAHDDGGQSVPIFSVLKDVSDGATIGMLQAAGSAETADAMFDLGTALNLSLRWSRDIDVATLAGALASAQSPGWGEHLWAAVRQAAAHAGIDVR